MEKSKPRSLTQKIVNVFIFIFFMVCIGILVVGASSKKDSANVFGYEMRVVLSSSMEKSAATDVSEYKIKSIPIKSMVFVKKAPSDKSKLHEWYQDLKVGDVLTFKYMYTRQETITHRIIDIKEKTTGGFIIKLEGDNKNSDSKMLAQEIDTSKVNNINYIIGKVVRVSNAIGRTVTMAQTPLGAVVLIIIPCVLMIGYEAHHISVVLNESKKQKALTAQKQKDDEIEKLKEQIKNLQKSNTDTIGGESND